MQVTGHIQLWKERGRKKESNRSRLPTGRKYSTVFAFPGSCAGFVSNIRDILAVETKHNPT